MSAAMLCQTTAEVCLRRTFRGPRSSSWNIEAEVAIEIARRQLLTAFEMNDVEKARHYLDSFAVSSALISSVRFSKFEYENFCGTWVTPPEPVSNRVVLFLHGGGYAFYPRGFYDNLSAMIAMEAKARLFALDYRLVPEHRFPSQLMDASAAYLWLLHSGVHSADILLVGDSAGGNLALALLLSLRDAKSPLPACAICLSPATDFGATVLNMERAELDWITPQMAQTWADWFCDRSQRSNPLISPVNADLRGLPPIYVQAGGVEILLPPMQAFAERAERHGVDIALDIWPEMPHDFAAFGYGVPQSAEALRRLGQVIAQHMSSSPKSESFPGL